MVDSEPISGNLNRHMQIEAIAFLDTLDHARTREALYPFDAGERFDWHYIPRKRPGLHLRNMDARQQRAAMALLRTGLSDTGFAAAQGIMALEEVIKPRDPGVDYDQGNFAFIIFGNPEIGAPWSWRVDGHHLSITFTIIDDDTVVALPHFMGADPATFDAGRPIHSVLGAEEDLARALMLSFDGPRRNRALIATDAPEEIVTGPGRERSLHRPSGLPFTAMSEDEGDRLLELVETYARRLRPELAAWEMNRLREAGTAGLHFAWAGGLAVGQPHYYRIHGPTLVIEYDNTRNHANHIHTVWHDPALDFGRDLLGEHYGRAH
ncbi:MAG TPA: DUF3500 domain-containing protein [Magnetospirillum sp.]|jgi:hypothetical protein|nr:DUF3500 domain-containing protein [Magnetospirillum sp.]